jgi:hypothetical protein
MIEAIEGGWKGTRNVQIVTAAREECGEVRK